MDAKPTYSNVRHAPGHRAHFFSGWPCPGPHQAQGGWVVQAAPLEQGPLREGEEGTWGGLTSAVGKAGATPPKATAAITTTPITPAAAAV